MAIQGGKQTLKCLSFWDTPNPMNWASVFTAMYRAGRGMLEPACEKLTIHIFTQIHVHWLYVSSLKISHNMKLENITNQDYFFSFFFLTRVSFKIFISTLLSPSFRRETLGIPKIGSLTGDLLIKMGL